MNHNLFAGKREPHLRMNQTLTGNYNPLNHQAARDIYEQLERGLDEAYDQLTQSLDNPSQKRRE